MELGNKTGTGHGGLYADDHFDGSIYVPAGYKPC